MKYPLYEHEKDKLKLPGGRSIRHLSLQSLEAGELAPQELGIDENALRAQARIAAEAGFPQLAENLRRAAEMTRMPDNEILAIYESLRPGRSTPDDLDELAQKMEETYEAPLTTTFLREAAAALRVMRQEDGG